MTVATLCHPAHAGARAANVTDRAISSGSGLGAAGLYAQYGAPIQRYIRQMVRDPSEAEDLTQETFLRAYSRLDSLQDPGALKSWLYRIATNVCYDRFRRPGPRAGTVSLDLLPGVEAEPPWGDPGDPSLAQALEQQEMSECVQRFIGELPDSYRSVILLHDLEGVTNNQIARMLDTSLDVVKIRLHRARRKLKATLAAGCQFSNDERGVLVCEPSDESPA